MLLNVELSGDGATPAELVASASTPAEDAGFVCEIQLSLAPLFKIKSGGAHAMYRVGRLFGFFNAANTVLYGEINQRVAAKAAAGLYVELQVRAGGDAAAIGPRCAARIFLHSPCQINHFRGSTLLRIACPVSTRYRRGCVMPHAGLWDASSEPEVWA